MPPAASSSASAEGKQRTPRVTVQELTDSTIRFVLEGTADDELPELILGAGRWPFADHSQLATFGA